MKKNTEPFFNCNNNIKIQEYQNSIRRSIFDIPLLDSDCVFFALIKFFFEFWFYEFLAGFLFNENN